MRARNFVTPLVTTVVCAIMIMVSSVHALPLANLAAEPPLPDSPAVAITPLLQYQGRMTNPTTGQPVADGVYAVTFTLYDAASAGTVKWTETKNVPVAGGLFSTALGDTSPLPQALFNGQALWLGIKVGSDLEATPRQAVLPVAYALGLVPGAAITGSLSAPALRISNNGGPALVTNGATTLGGNVTINGTLSGGTHTHNGADITSGIVAEPRIEASLARDTEVMPLVLGNDGAGSTLDADLLDGLQGNAYALAAHTHDGSAITTGLVADAHIDPLIARDAEVAASYYNKTDADNRFVNNIGPESISVSSTLAGLAINQTGAGGSLFGSSSNSYGGYFSGVSGVIGKGLGGYGGYFTSTNNVGLYADSQNSYGIRAFSRGGVNAWSGIFGQTDSAYTSDAGVYGYSTGNAAGVQGYSTSGNGVVGTTDATTASAGYFYNNGGAGTNRGVGVAGFSGSGGPDDTHPGGSFWKAAGEFAGPNGLIGAASENNGVGIVAVNAFTGTALYADKPSGTGNALSVYNNGAGTAASINNASGSAADALLVSNSGTGNALNLYNYGPARSAYIYNSSSSTGEAVSIANYGSSTGLNVANYGAGGGAYFYNSSARSGDAFSFSNYGTGDTLNIYPNATTGSGIYVSNSSSNTSTPVSIYQNNSATGYGLYVYKAGRGNYSGYFYGNMYVAGTYGGGTLVSKMDHPLDPANKYLEHTAVESPDMMNVYNGNITTDANGDATVVLPDYFEALNRDFRYQLTAIGQFAQVIVQDEIKDNRFTIKTDKPNVKVSWQVTGIRQDPWANDNRSQVEVTKAANEQGLYLYPEGYGKPESSGIDYAAVKAGPSSKPTQPVPQTPPAPLTQTVPLQQTAPLPATGSTPASRP